MSQQRNCPSQDKNTTFMFWNSGGLTQAKSLELQQIIHVNKIDAFGIVEAGAITDDDHIFQPSDYPEYNIQSLPRSRKKGSGILVAYRKELTCKITKVKSMLEDRNKPPTDPEFDKCEIMQMELWKNDQKTIFFVIYNPPGNLPTTINDLRIDKNTIVLGDFNAHNTMWNYTNNDATGEMLEDFIHTSPLLLLEPRGDSHTYTHFNGNRTRPDLALIHVSLVNSVQQTNINSPSGRDHDILKIIRSSNKTPANQPKKNSWSFKKAKWEKFREITEQRLTEDIITDNIDNSNKRFVEILHECAKESIPRGFVKGYRPHWNDDLERLKDQRDAAKQKINNAEDKTEATANLNKCQAMLRKAILESQRDTFCQFLEKIDYRKDGAKAHSFFSKLCGKKQNNKTDVNVPLKYKNKELHKDKMKAEAHCEHIHNLSKGNIKKLKIRKIKHIDSTQYSYNADFKLTELNFALNKLSYGKSPGIDKVHNEFLKNLGPQGKNCLLKLINLSLKKGTPVEWRKAEIITLPKKGKDPTKVDSYRPIALTSAIAKVAEHMVNQRLTTYLEANKLLSPEQAGFRQHRSTMDQAAAFTQDVKEKLDSKESTLAVLVDFKAAFDTVWREKVIQKLQQARAPSNLVRWIKSFLSQRLIRVKVNNSRSKFRQPRRGVPQGTVTSPMLFNVLINDLPDVLKTVPGIKVKMFADDVIIWVSGSDPAELECRMNLALQKLHDWVKENELTVNTSKTTYDYYTLKHTIPKFNLTLGNNTINHSPNPTYLGITMDTKMTGKTHIANITCKAKKRLGLVRRVAATKWGAKTSVLATTYKTYVRPVLENGTEVFVTAPANALATLDRVQNQALRVITGGVKTTPIAAMEQYSNVEPLNNRREKAAVTLHEKLIRLDPSWDRDPVASMKTQKSFIEKSNELKKQYLKAGIVNAPRQPILHKPIFNTFISVSVRTSIDGLDNRRGSYTNSELKDLALKHIQAKYPPDKWMHIYTDGSATPGKGLAGAGVTCEMFNMALPAGKLGCNYDGEVVAIQAALQRLVLQNPPPQKNLVILTDSMAAIQAISSPESQNSTIVEIRTLVHGIQRNCEVMFQWIPSHCDLPGNDKADELAKAGASMKQPATKIPLHTVKAHLAASVKEKTRKEWTTAGRGKNWPKVQAKEEKRSVATAQFRLNTGHDLLGCHLKRFNITKDNKCTLCNQVKSDRSHLFRCSAIKSDIDNLPAQLSVQEKEAHLYWLMRMKMASRP